MTTPAEPTSPLYTTGPVYVDGVYVGTHYKCALCGALLPDGVAITGTCDDSGAVTSVQATLVDGWNADGSPAGQVVHSCSGASNG